MVDTSVHLHMFGDEVSRLRPAIAQVKCKGSLFNLSISFNGSRVLAQVFCPRFHQTRFDKATRIGGVAIQTPAKCPIPPAKPFHVAHRASKFRRATWID